MKLKTNVYLVTKFVFVFIAILISVKVTLAQTETSTFDTKPVLKAKLNRNAFQSGEVVKLFLSVKNENYLIVSLFDVQPERSFNFTVKDANGSNVPVTQEGQKKMHPNIIMARESISLEPSKTFEFREIRLDELFDLTQSGNYALEVKRSYYFEDDLTNEMLCGKGDCNLTASVEFSVE